MSFSNDTKMIRHKCLTSQIEFIEALGVSFATVNRLESGKSNPNFKTIKLLEDSNTDTERSIDGITDFMSRTTSNEIKKDIERIAQERR